jgi:energy-coupling factor transporter ATP-binding protein EcfA2
MSEPSAAPASSAPTEPTITRPTISFETITFSDGQTLWFDDDEIIVFVGPNNAGKSAALRELQNWIARSIGQTVITKATLRKTGGADDLKAYLEKNALKLGEVGQWHYSGMGYQIHHSHTGFFDREDDRHPIAAFFSARMATEVRITASDPAGPIALYKEPPTHPIHLLLKDPELGNTLSGHFRRAFGQDLIVFRAGGSSFPLYVGEKPKKNKDWADELDKSFVEALLAAAQPLSSQGDGMRSFATILLYALASDTHSVQFLDEPEAFLHPPQAKLIGEYLAKHRVGKSQLFIATHSADVLDGLVAGGTKKVRIVRIQREGDVNCVKELSKEKTATIANDTLTRYSGVFSGIFYRHVIIAESDSDCLFYNSILHTTAVRGEVSPDVLFIHAAGKHRMAKLVETLRSLDVPVSVVADIDLLNEEGTFRGLFETLGGDWKSVAGHWQAVKTGVEQLRPPLNAEQVKSMLLHELNGVLGTGPFPKTAERGIKNVFKTLSPWDVVKQAGRAGVRGADTVQHFDELIEKCGALGLWIVPVGEAEGFCRSIQASHGPGFAQKVLEERDLELDPELEEARAFVRKIWERAKPKPASDQQVARVKQA